VYVYHLLLTRGWLQHVSAYISHLQVYYRNTRCLLTRTHSCVDGIIFLLNVIAQQDASHSPSFLNITNKKFSSSCMIRGKFNRNSRRTNYFCHPCLCYLILGLPNDASQKGSPSKITHAFSILPTELHVQPIILSCISPAQCCVIYMTHIVFYYVNRLLVPSPISYWPFYFQISNNTTKILLFFAILNIIYRRFINHVHDVLLDPKLTFCTDTANSNLSGYE
jgi:hypothetical protein